MFLLMMLVATDAQEPKSLVLQEFQMSDMTFPLFFLCLLAITFSMKRNVSLTHRLPAVPSFYF